MKDNFECMQKLLNGSEITEVKTITSRINNLQHKNWLT